MKSRECRKPFNTIIQMRKTLDFTVVGVAVKVLEDDMRYSRELTRVPECQSASKP
jgi:hypothetical protein